MVDTVSVGRYILIERLGSGGTAEVFRAEDVSLGRTVAFKRFHPRFLDDEVLAARVQAEVRLARDLRHAGIAALYEFVAQGDGVARTDVGIAMEYLPGGDLRRRILLRGALSPEEVARIGRELLEALAYAHERGIVHRDIKPRNVLFSENGAAKLADFGLARSMSTAGLCDRDSVAGTAEYTAPETITSSLWDARSDLYAVGCTLFEALTGRPPYTANTPPEVLRKHVEEPVPDLPSVPGEDLAASHPALAITITTLLQKDPNDRPQTASEALRMLSGGVGRASTHADRRTPCPSCGAPMSPRYGWCFTCHKPTIPLTGLKRGGSAVFVTGPGRRGEKLQPELRDACSEAAEAMGLDTTEMRKRVPRLPFVIARRLERGGAMRLAAELESRSIRTTIVGRGDESVWVGRGLILRKAMTMAPRIYAIFAGMSGAFIQFLMRLPPYAAVGGIGVVLAGVPVVAALTYRRSTTRIARGAEGRVGLELTELFVGVDDPLIHARVKNIVEAGGRLAELAATDESLPEDVRAEVQRAVEASVSRAARLGLALHEIRSGGRYARQAAALTRDGTGREDAQESVELLRRMDSLYTRTLESIGSTALAIHEASIRLARSHQDRVRSRAAELRTTVSRLSDSTDAWRELEEELHGSV